MGWWWCGRSSRGARHGVGGRLRGEAPDVQSDHGRPALRRSRDAPLQDRAGRLCPDRAVHVDECAVDAVDYPLVFFPLDRRARRSGNPVAAPWRPGLPSAFRRSEAPRPLPGRGASSPRGGCGVNHLPGQTWGHWVAPWSAFGRTWLFSIPGTVVVDRRCPSAEDVAASASRPTSWAR